MDEDDFALVLWGIYQGACWCHLDMTNNTCKCSAADDAADALRRLFGDRWHDIMRHRTT